MFNTFAIDVLKNLIKINRFKLVMRLLSKKDKKGKILISYFNSEIISIRDLYNNL